MKHLEPIQSNLFDDYYYTPYFIVNYFAVDRHEIKPTKPPLVFSTWQVRSEVMTELAVFDNVQLGLSPHVIREAAQPPARQPQLLVHRPVALHPEPHPRPGPVHDVVYPALLLEGCGVVGTRPGVVPGNIQRYIFNVTIVFV